MEENYEKLLKPIRRRPSSRGMKGLVEESESDRSRILYSAAFRRLQRKTQVFPLEENAAVRSRLTHSLEVAHVGRYLATSVVDKFASKRKLRKYHVGPNERLALASIVDTACLAHDIGNPPFGHFGEAAISAWADKLVDGKFCSANEARAGGKKRFGTGKEAEIVKDFSRFDGNPQGFRIMASIAGVDGNGMNLTAAQLAATVKYPCFASETTEKNPILKKAGVFHSEREVWGWVRESFGLKEKVRFPLAFLMEAADDISYCLSDIEDGIEKGYTSHKAFYAEVRHTLEKSNASTAFLDDVLTRAKNSAASVDETIFVRTSLVRRLVDEASTAYVDKHSSIFSGAAIDLLDKNSEAYILLDAIRETVKNQLYGRRASVELELTGYTAITGILKKYESIIDLSESDFLSLKAPKVRSSLVEAQRLYSLFPPKYLATYERSIYSLPEGEVWCARVRLVMDFVAGMTDVFALQTYQIFKGIR